MGWRGGFFLGRKEGGGDRRDGEEGDVKYVSFEVVDSSAESAVGE